MKLLSKFDRISYLYVWRNKDSNLQGHATWPLQLTTHIREAERNIYRGWINESCVLGVIVAPSVYHLLATSEYHLLVTCLKNIKDFYSSTSSHKKYKIKCEENTKKKKNHNINK